MRSRIAGLFLALLAASLHADTKIVLNKTSVSSLLDVQEITVPAGERVILSVPVLSGNIWFKNGEPIFGATGRTFIINSATPEDSGRYRLGYMGDATTASQELLLTVAPGNGSAAPHLQTFSTRGLAGSGNQLLVAGFVVSDAPGRPGAAQTLLIRAVGPTLETFGETGVLEQPVLAIYDAQGKRIQPSTTDSLALAQANLATGAFPLKPGAADAVGLYLLPPGSYTAQVSAPDGQSGVVLLDIYDVPAGN